MNIFAVVSHTYRGPWSVLLISVCCVVHAFHSRSKPMGSHREDLDLSYCSFVGYMTIIILQKKPPSGDLSG